MNKDIVLGVGSFGEYIASEIQLKRLKAVKETVFDTSKLLVSKKDLNDFIHRVYKDKYRIVQSKDNAGWIIDDSLDSYIDYYVSGTTATVQYIGDRTFVDANKQIFDQTFDKVESYIKWIHSSNGDYITMALETDLMPVDGMYPFLKDETLHEYYDRFLHSTSSILLLIGPPGTGKTTFIRGLLDYAKTSAAITYDPTILDKDGVFADWIEDDETSLMILEDSDTFLSSRTDGNSLMHRFLNVSNGLVTSKGKKMIFSTNLPSVRDVDPALIRPGRCFDIVKFQPLQYNEAHDLANSFGIKLRDKPSGELLTWTVAEIFHEQNVKPVLKFGFNQ